MSNTWQFIFVLWIALGTLTWALLDLERFSWFLGAVVGAAVVILGWPVFAGGRAGVKVADWWASRA